MIITDNEMLFSFNNNVKNALFFQGDIKDTLIDNKEIELGEPKGKPREKFTYVEEMLSVVK